MDCRQVTVGYLFYFFSDISMDALQTTVVPRHWYALRVTYSRELALKKGSTESILTTLFPCTTNTVCWANARSVN